MNLIHIEEDKYEVVSMNYALYNSTAVNGTWSLFPYAVLTHSLLPSCTLV